MRSALHNKLHSRRGESLAEVLVAMLIIALAVLTLAATVSAAGSINMETREHDEHFYAELTAAEACEVYPEPGTGPSATPHPYKLSVEVQKPDPGGKWPEPGGCTTTDVSVNMYGGSHLLSYKYKAG